MSDKPIKSGCAAHRYLVGLGYKVSQAKVYKDLDEGRFGKSADGTFSPKTLKAYAKAFLEPVAGKPKDDGGSEAATKRLLADADLRSVQAARAQLKLEAEQGSLIPRAEHELALASRAQFFRNQVNVFCHKAAPRIVACCGGDESKAPLLVEFLLDETSRWLDAFAAECPFIVEEMTRG
ncbi:MAG: hypothetical protein AB7D37_06265 [Desulfovibrio sp.]